MSLDPFWKFSLPSYSSDITKQLSTFHLPPCGGDENVLAKDLKQWPILVFIWLFSQYCTRIAVFGKSFPLHHVSRSKTTSLAYYFHSNITNVNATYSHQRPPSVGMPRHALRRRMPNSATGRPQFPLGGQCCCVHFFPAVGEGPSEAGHFSGNSFLIQKSGKKPQCSNPNRQNELKFGM